MVNNRNLFQKELALVSGPQNRNLRRRLRRKLRNQRGFVRRRNVNNNNRIIPRMMNATPRELSNQLNIQRPLALTPINKNTQRSTALGKTILHNREFMGSLLPGANYFNLQPGHSGCAALDYQSLGFDNYKLHQATIEFRSNVSTNTNGRVVMTIDYEGQAPQTIEQAMASNMSKTTNVYRNANLIAKPSSLMKQKLHAVAHDGTEQEIRGTPTSCGTVAVFVDGTPSDIGVIGTIYLYYNIELVNFTGTRKNNNQNLTQITSQVLSTNLAPSLAPPIVSSDNDVVNVVERGALEASSNSLVDGFQLEDTPGIGESFTIATTPLAITGTTAVPSIRVRNSNGEVVPANFYQLNSNPSSLINKQNLNTHPFKDYHAINQQNVDASVIDLFITTVTFVKSVADFVSDTTKLILEVVKPFVSTSDADTVDLTDQVTAIDSGNSLEIVLPDNPSQPAIDNFNSSTAIYLEQKTGSGINCNVSRDNFYSGAGLNPTSVQIAIMQTDGTFSDFQTFTDSGMDIEIPGASPEIALKLNYSDPDNTYFKLGKTYNFTGVYGGIAGFSALAPVGHIIPSDTTIVPSSNIFPFNNTNDQFVQNFTPTSNTSNYSISFRVPSSLVANFLVANAKAVFTVVISDLTDVDRELAIPISTVFQSKLYNRFKSVRL